MAEIVSVVVDKLIPLIAQEANLLKGVHGEVKSIKDELESIASFLVEADAREAKGESNDNIRTWVKQVRDLAYRIEDVIDLYTHHIARRRHEQGVSKFLPKTGRSIWRIAARHEIASEIEDIKKHVLDVKSRADRYGLMIISAQQGMVGGGVTSISVSPISSLFIAESEVVGMEGPTETLKSWLSDQEDGKGERMVISVVGMGGLGKTTLVRKLYDSHIDKFDCHAWLTVSQTFSTKQVLKSIIRQFYQAQKESAPASIEAMVEIECLIMELHSYVKQKRYVVVFDDVWSRELCENMLHALSENKKCSKIIFTTRSEDVAPTIAQSSRNRVYKLPLLSSEKAFELFCNKVFQSVNGGGACPQELENLSREIVKKCDGLPLAIVAVGGILSRKEKNVSEWKKFQNSLISKLQSDEQMTRVNEILSLSVHDLSPKLKSCSLYFSIYPEDCSIRCSRLIRQWIAEGFVKAKNNEVLEDVAEEYLTELIRRNVIQVSEVDWCGKVRECRMHDLMREVILLRSKEIRFCSVLGEHNVDGKARRLSMVKNDLITPDIISNNVNFSVIRSFFVFQSQLSDVSKDFTRGLFGNSKLLTMLDFEGSQVRVLHECVGDLYHLSYLSVRKTKVEMLPKSIGKLSQLQTLDFKESRVLELPFEIKRLRKLRHLLGYSHNREIERYTLGYRQGVKLKGGLECWETLQKLCYVNGNVNGATIKELINFKNLRKLGITSVRSENGIDLCNAIETMKELRSLEIKADLEQVLDLETVHSPPPFLQRLLLIGRLKALPSWINKLQNLIRLGLRWSGLANDPLEVLQNLPNLLDLNFSYNAFNTDQLHFKVGGFPKLKSLRLLDLKELKELKIEEGALPCLEYARIGQFSEEMMEAPSGIRCLKNLKFLRFLNFSEEFCMKMVPGGPDWSIIQHIPIVVFRFSSGIGKCETFTPASYVNRSGGD